MSAVRRRHVFYLGGFDPKGASYSHGLYRAEAARQSGVTGAVYEVGPRVRCEGGNTTWQVRSRTDGQDTETTFEYVQWDDIVRAHWPRNGWQVLVGSLRGYQAALASLDALKKVWRASPRTLVSLAYPALFWVMVFLSGLACGAVLATLVRTAGGPGVYAALPWMAGAIAAFGIWGGALAWERRLNTTWLLRIYQFAGDWRRGRTPSVPPRMDRLAADIVKRLSGPALDEILVVGFSVGSLLAVSAVARVQALAAPAGGPNLDRLSLMTLGHCIPLLGLMAGADAFRAELARLGQDPQVRWWDFSSPTDWGSFALVDPLAICLGEGGPGRPYAPHMASPRFHTMFEPGHYARIIRDKRRMHLQYLMAGELPTLYDYFAITAGPLSLPGRFSDTTAP
ncbi:MAG: hypothetical protein ABIR26_10175 [Ramlibacter sp.]